MLTSIVVTVAAALIIAFLLHLVFRRLDPSTIQGYRPCAGNWCEARKAGCEDGLTRIPQQPINTWSNLAYFVGGLFLALTLRTPESFIFALTMTYLCVGSSLYHATSTVWAGSLDVSAIYAAFSALTLYALCTLLLASGFWVMLVMLVGAGLSAYLLRYQYKGDMQLKIGIFLGLTYHEFLVSLHLHSRWELWPYAVVSFALFALAFLVWNIDKRPGTPLGCWGHGVWHLFTAGATSVLFYGVSLLL